MDKIKKLFKNKKFLIGAAIFVIVIVYFSAKRDQIVYDEVRVEKGTLIQEVSVTGAVKPVENVSLSFERSGKVLNAPVKVGDKVARGQVLLSLDTTSDVLELRQSEADLAASEAALAQLVRGTRAEDLAVLESKMGAAQTALADAKTDLIDKLKDSYTKADDAVRNYADQFFDNARSSSPQLNITTIDNQLRTDLIALRIELETTLSSWEVLAQGAENSSDLAGLVLLTRNNLNKVSVFLSKLSSVVNSLIPTTTLSQTTITTYKANVSTARTAINTALANVSTGEDGYNTAAFNLDLAVKNFNVGIAGSAPEEIEAAEAKVLGDRARIDNIKHSIYTASIRAPFAGVVTRQDAKIGEVAAVNTSLVSLIGMNNFEIEANVPEADIAKLSLGNSAEVTLDAYGSDIIFPAKILTIDPAEVLIDNVATYKVTLEFIEQDPRIRSGMTANIDILSAKNEGVLLVPTRAIISDNGGKTVQIRQADGAVANRIIETGLRSSDGKTEILSGLDEGEIIVVGER